MEVGFAGSAVSAVAAVSAGTAVSAGNAGSDGSAVSISMTVDSPQLFLNNNVLSR